MESYSEKLISQVSNSTSSKKSIWSSLLQVIASFDSPITKNYIAACNSYVERILSKSDPTICGEDLVSVLQTELPIPTSVSQLPPSGILGICVNLITIVVHSEEDPVELVLDAFT